jgi:hypothetical protein
LSSKELRLLLNYVFSIFCGQNIENKDAEMPGGEGVLGGNFAWKASATYFPHPVLVPISTAGSGDNFAEVSMALNDAECPTLVAQRQGENHVGWGSALYFLHPGHSCAATREP